LIFVPCFLKKNKVFIKGTNLSKASFNGNKVLRFERIFFHILINMQINLLEIVFYTLILVKSLASDVEMEINEFGILERNQFSSLNTIERDERLFSGNDETLDMNNLVAPPLPQSFNNQNQEETDNCLSGITTERIVDHLVEPDRRHSSGNFLQSFILCDVPNPCPISEERWGDPTVLELAAALVCLCIIGFIIFLILISTCDPANCLASKGQV
jgi:hypothetical protein